MRRISLHALPLSIAAALVVGSLGVGPASAEPLGPLPAVNPHLGPARTSTMHGDGESSDGTVLPGVGSRPVRADFVALGAACTTILQGSDGLPQALCTSNADRSPVMHLLDPDTGRSLASMPLVKGSLLGGVYAFLDDQDRLVAVDGNANLLRIGHSVEENSAEADRVWRLHVDDTTPLQAAATAHCGAADCDSVDSIMADHQGRVWFATGGGAVGVVDPASRAAKSIALPGERVANSIATSPAGTAVATDHALYLLEVDDSGAPEIMWSKNYDRGPARKPGQLSWGTGASPTFFGPRTGTDYLTITDNAAPVENLLVYEARTGRQICSIPAVDGSENSPIGAGNSVFVSSTFGYPYPSPPQGAGPSVPTQAAITGGMTRIDVDADGDGCSTRWTNGVPSSAVPRLSVADGKIYTVSRDSTVPEDAPVFGSLGNHQPDPVPTPPAAPGPKYSFTVIDAATGKVTADHTIGTGPQYNTLQTVGTIATGTVHYQGAVTGVFRITTR